MLLRAEDAGKDLHHGPPSRNSLQEARTIEEMKNPFESLIDSMGKGMPPEVLSCKGEPVVDDRHRLRHFVETQLAMGPAYRGVIGSSSGCSVSPIGGEEKVVLHEALLFAPLPVSLQTAPSIGVQMIDLVLDGLCPHTPNSDRIQVDVA